MLINNHIIRDFILSDLTNEPLNKDSKLVKEYFDNIFSYLIKEIVNDGHIVWVSGPERTWLINYYPSTKEVSMTNNYVNYLIASLSQYYPGNNHLSGENQLLLFMLEKYLEIEIIQIKKNI